MPLALEDTDAEETSLVVTDTDTEDDDEGAEETEDDNEGAEERDNDEDDEAVVLADFDVVAAASTGANARCDGGACPGGNCCGV